MSFPRLAVGPLAYSRNVSPQGWVALVALFGLALWAMACLLPSPQHHRRRNQALVVLGTLLLLGALILSFQFTTPA